MARHLFLAVLHGSVQVLELVDELPAFLDVVGLEELRQALRQLFHDSLKPLHYLGCLFGGGLVDFLLELKNLEHELGVLNFGLVVDVDPFQLHLSQRGDTMQTALLRSSRRVLLAWLMQAEYSTYFWLSGVWTFLSGWNSFCSCLALVAMSFSLIWQFSGLCHRREYIEKTLKQLIIFSQLLHSGFLIFFWQPLQSKLAQYLPEGSSVPKDMRSGAVNLNSMLTIINYQLVLHHGLFPQQAQTKTLQQLMLQLVLIILAGLKLMAARPVVVNGGEVTLNGIVTDTQIDFTLNYTANVRWLAIIFSKDEVNTDMHLLVRDPTDAARPVKVYDAYLDENSHIVYDDVNNIMPSVTAFWGDVSNGLKVAYNRDLNTNDNQDKRLYPNDIIQVCFMSSLATFVGGGFETGNEKICSFFSLHMAVNQYQDRLLGNYAATTLIGGANLTLYATQSTEGNALEPWLFMGIVFKRQGLTPFTGRWIGVTYVDSLSNTDLAIVEYGTRNFLFDVNALDMYVVNSTSAAQDLDYPLLQGGTDIYKNLGGANPSEYMVSLFKRKFSTGDNNRDINVTAGENKTFCFLLGRTWAFTSFVYDERICLSLTITTSYYSSFRVSSSAAQASVDYVTPPNTVVVIVKWQQHLAAAVYLLGLVLLSAVG